MRIPRLYVDIPLQVGTVITLSADRDHYIRHVLRLRVGASICLFNGLGGEYSAQLIELNKKNAKVQIYEFVSVTHESSLSLTLVQAISKSDHMDYTLQKSVELGVNFIIPVLTERSPPLDHSTDG